MFLFCRDDFPSTWICPSVVGPFSRGDNPLQYYNTMFSLQYLNEYADAVVYTNNDIMSKSSLNRDDNVGGSANFEHMNQSFAEDLASVFFPLGSTSAQSSDQNMGQFISTLCPLRRHRFIRVGSSSSKKQVAWEILSKKATERLGIERGSPHVAFAAHVVVRGYDGKAQTNKDIETPLLKYNKGMSSWHPSSTTTVHADRPMALTSRSVAMAVNRSEMGSVVRYVSRMAAIKFHSRAYLHSYRRYGIDQDDFAEAFESMNNIVAAYDEMLLPTPP